MKGASLGRRLGDWLGLVLDDEIAVSAALRRQQLARLEVSDSRESTCTERPAAEPRHAPAAIEPKSQRTRRVVPATREYRADVLSLREAIRDLRAGLEPDALDES